MAAKPIYERLKGESPRAFHAFTLYRDMGPKRSQDKVQAELDTDTTDEGQKRGKKRASVRVQDWSVKWSWVERAEAWDDHVDREHHRQLLRGNNAAIRRQVNASQFIQDIGAKRLKTVDPEDLSPMQALNYALTGAREERQLRGIDPGDKGDVLTRDQYMALTAQMMVLVRQIFGGEKFPQFLEGVQAMLDKPPEPGAR